jgi:ketosteroid isomerase-like protein
LDAWNHEDPARYLEIVSPAFVFHTAGVFPSHDAVYRGHDGFLAFWETFHDAWERLDIDIARLEDLGDCVLALLNFRAVGKGSGIEVRRKFANVATFADGLVVDIRAYADWDQALEAVGLRE